MFNSYLPLFFLLCFVSLGLSSEKLHGQCNGNTVLTVTDGSTGTWVNNTGNSVLVRITAIGAGGGNGDVLVNNNPGGSGATMVGEFVVLNGESIRAIAGAAGLASNGAAGGGGGGGSGAVNCGTVPDCSTGTIMLLASGGGGGGLGTLASDAGVGGSGDLINCGDAGLGGTGNSGAGGGGVDANGANGIGSVIIATGGIQVDRTGVSNGGTGGGDGLGLLAGDGGAGMGGGGGGGLSEGGGGAGHTGGNAGGLVLGDSGGTGGISCNLGTNQANIYGTNGGGANAGSVVIECLGTSLPVEFTNFATTVVKDHVALQWETASEIDNEGFFIQHSSEAKNWENIGFVDGQGTHETTEQYAYVHTQPLTGPNYYRLKQVDFDGQTTYSSIAIAMMDRSNTINTSFYPNPAKSGSINLKISDASANEALVLFYDATGRKVFSKVIAIQDQEGSSSSLAVHHLPAGMYTAMVLIGDKKTTEKIIIGTN